MEERIVLPGPHLWTRDAARPHRDAIEKRLETLSPGDTLIIDASGVKVFDYSFAAELFGRTLIALPHSHPGRFVVVEHLTEYARENLDVALRQLDLAILERSGAGYRLIGKYHPSDAETLNALIELETPVAAASLSEHLGMSVNAVNERLGKLASMGLVRRERRRSPSGREQFEYWPIR